MAMILSSNYIILLKTKEDEIRFRVAGTSLTRSAVSKFDYHFKLGQGIMGVQVTCENTVTLYHLQAIVGFS